MLGIHAHATSETTPPASLILRLNKDIQSVFLNITICDDNVLCRCGHKASFYNEGDFWEPDDKVRWILRQQALHAQSVAQHLSVPML